MERVDMFLWAIICAVLLAFLAVLVPDAIDQELNAAEAKIKAHVGRMVQ